VKSTIRRYYKEEGEQTAAFKLFQSILDKNDIPLIEILNRINKGFDYAAKSEIIMELLEVAYADNYLRSVENSKLEFIVEKLNITQTQYKSINAIFKEKNDCGCYKEESFRYTGFSENSSYNYKDGNKSKNKSEFNYYILVLLAEMMKADGRNLTCELDCVKATIRKLYKTEEEQKAALKQFQTILEGNYDINEIYRRINENFDFSAKSDLLIKLLEVAYSDDIFSNIEDFTFTQIRHNLNISRAEYKNIFLYFKVLLKEKKKNHNKQSNSSKSKKSSSKSSNNKEQYKNSKEENDNHSNQNESRRPNDISVNNAYNILGVSEETPDAEVKKAYRALAIMYHPDKVSSLGDEAIRQATESMKQINHAWDVVKEARGMK
ncbi:MAG: TerB family tellurite resistance protein, partial [Paludibacteraceae bacterium]|nr:TerB family tellurite resistance protein [Paludibacteraceae bacterium]